MKNSQKICIENKISNFIDFQINQCEQLNALFIN